MTSKNQFSDPGFVPILLCFGTCAVLEVTRGFSHFAWLSLQHRLATKRLGHGLVVLYPCRLLQIHFMNLSLRVGNALVVIPTYYTFNTVLSVAGGMVYFEEYSALSLTQGLLFIAGVSVRVPLGGDHTRHWMACSISFPVLLL